MIALDTNVLVRYIVRDDEDQHLRARALVDRVIAAEDSFLIPDVVLAELVWVLQRSYGLARGEILRVLRALYSARHVRLVSADRIARSLRAYEAGAADFADYLIAEQARDVGCETVATFDSALLEEDGFVEP